MSSSEGRDVRFWPLADIPYVAFDVAFGGKADIHQTCRPKADIARLTHQHAKAIRGQFTPISRRYVQSPKGQVSPLVPPAIPADAPAGVCVLEATSSLCARRCDARRAGNLPNIFYLSAMLPRTRQRLIQSRFGAEREERRCRYSLICR